MKARIALVALGVLAAFGVTSVAVQAQQGGAPERPKVIIADSEDLLPGADATDWVTYADHLAIVTVTGQQELAATPDEIAAGEGFVPRSVSVKVDKVLWSRSGAAAAPASMTWDIDGWMFHGTDRTPIRLDGEPSLNVGERYVVPITYLSVTDAVDEAGWEPLNASEIFPDSNGTIGSGATVYGYDGPADDGTTDLRDQVWGQPESALVGILGSTAVDPAASGYMGLPPDQRYRTAKSSDATTG
ncbi:hypothetical protein ACIQU5_03505 [Streptomyces sp. NPDC090306]|uniref:hypothetical protein n=1 Tax=Streptomyces sp. NPDC090306 TaxID=3365961 RepID=UPI00382C5A65